jgi:predicted O-linked N-acetylglucosamine transferase (SPINDLY family)
MFLTVCMSVNRNETLGRIRNTLVDVLIFADAGQDCRSFALAHYRLAPLQLAMWGWGGTLAINTIDYYLFPDVFWTGAKCRVAEGALRSPQELYAEQVNNK